MEDCNSNTPTGDSGQICSSPGAANAYLARNELARRALEWGDKGLAVEAINQHGIYEVYRAQDERR